MHEQAVSAGGRGTPADVPTCTPGGVTAHAPGGGQVSGASVTYLWPATPRSVSRARHMLAEALDGWGMGAVAETAVLVLSELVTNAVRHSRVPERRVETRFVRTDHGVRLEVHDASGALPQKRRAGDDEENGRGLALVEALTGPECWGFGSREGVGKMVWAYVEPRDDGAIR